MPFSFPFFFFQGAQGWWQCTVTHTYSFALPEMWTCSLSENCCLTGRHLGETGCCQTLTPEKYFSPQANSIACSPPHSRTYYCPSGRDCCTVARSGGANETGCCISQVAKDQAITGKDAKNVKPGVEESEDDPKLGRRYLIKNANQIVTNR